MDGPENREVELKLRVPESHLERLRRDPTVRAMTRGRPATRTLESVYFDTADLDLLAAGLSLRVRRVGRGFVQTLKTREPGQAGLFARGEWEVGLPEAVPDPNRVTDPAARARLVQACAGKPLAPVVETLIRRTGRTLVAPGPEGLREIRFDLDVGEVRAGGRAAPICELELELVRGEPVALYEVALALHRGIPLRPSIQDKAELGFDLLLGRGPVPVRARSPVFARNATLDDALSVVFASGLSQALANEEPARAGDDPEGVHQMRVGVRRLRAAFSLFRELIPAEHGEPFKQELRWLGGELADARDLDVFLMETLEPLSLRPGADPTLKRLVDVAREMRAEAYDRVRAALASERYGSLLLGLGAWIGARGWREQPLSPESALLFGPARARADGWLRRRERKLRRHAKGLAHRTREEQHEVRMRLKKLRYGAEFFACLYGNGRTRKTLRRLSRLQDVLGHLNDQAVAERLLDRILERLGPEAGPAHHRAAGLVVGWTARGAEDHLERLGRRWKAFARRKTFWSKAD